MCVQKNQLNHTNRPKRDRKDRTSKSLVNIPQRPLAPLEQNPNGGAQLPRFRVPRWGDPRFLVSFVGLSREACPRLRVEYSSYGYRRCQLVCVEWSEKVGGEGGRYSASVLGRALLRVQVGGRDYLRGFGV